MRVVSLFRTLARRRGCLPFLGEMRAILICYTSTAACIAGSVQQEHCTARCVLCTKDPYGRFRSSLNKVLISFSNSTAGTKSCDVIRHIPSHIFLV